MKTKLMLAICAALFLSSTAMATQSYDHGDNDHRQNDHGKNDRGQNDHGRNDHGHGGSVMHDRGAHEGWYRKGGVMPNDYRGNQYVVSDWRSENLREPPRGYNWVRSDNGDFLLVAVTTGVITSILLQH